MGPLMAWPTWFIQTGRYSWTPVLVAIPVGFLVSAILNGNDVRDIARGRSAGIVTLASGMGLSRGLLLQRRLYRGAFFFPIDSDRPENTSRNRTVALRSPAGFPQNTLRTINEAEAGRQDRLLQLEAMAAQFHFQFGILLAAGLAVHPWLAGKGL